ncbi:pilus assembly FimT family protein [Coleofasciculus sp. E2-BRE-01]|uniref:pilus assembly FimT family protein n=1 Tax=Coleofasciculus sp. E2-BRE-01 TaxID=3069524 RepID=UPI0032FA27CE
MIAILSAIAAPGWLAFVNRQRVAKVSDAVFSAMQEAQREAKRTKLSYSVSFREKDGVPQVATHRTFDEDRNLIINDIATQDEAWKRVGEGLEIKANQVLLCSNVGTDFNKEGSLTCDLSTPRTITFDYLGNLAETATGDEAHTPLIVTAGIPQSNNSSDVIDATKRCVQVKTLIGSMQVGQEDECNP